MKRLFAKAGIEEHFTNHSLHHTCATCLFKKGIEEKVIMSITGHKSTDVTKPFPAHRRRQQVM